MINTDARSIARHFEDAEHQAMPHQLFTLVFPMNTAKSHVLLGMKKRGFGCSKYEGLGGKVELDESIDEGAIRELNEESGLLATRFEKHGMLLFYYEDNPVAMEVHVYLVSDYMRDVVETDEMRPEWFGINELPFAQMWPDAARWWPHVLRSEKFVGRFWFKADKLTIAHEEFSCVESFSF
ncbi:Nudix (Nucleoside diphosphate linked moiety X)-type motif 1 [Coemansia sp. RSA 1287]|nr:Nudix (Nucleoside diphosphate linked moiety X)-type motif 1 [Coemansia sp. RSA 560]KAJ2250410.1 Nudix (Nucleoside diphosphate linked moiety X)-type motif 1 [Coemansia sp. RSA 454]KAJ2645407.1 Nudix (Nucleoside diphosphate linked moiety X)-type motif 1 [Coemansia sp. RSA 1287]